MKIAIASEGKEKSSKVSETGGRAPFYLIFKNKELTKTIKNPFRFGGGGAGFAVAQMLADEKIDMVISGGFGSNMLGALKSKGIKHKEMADVTVEKALEKQ